MKINEANHYSLVEQNKSIKESASKKPDVKTLISQIKSKQEDILDLDFSKVKKNDKKGKENQIDKLPSWGCLRTKGGVHCPKK